MPANWELCFPCLKTKQKHVPRRDLYSLKIWLTEYKKVYLTRPHSFLSIQDRWGHGKLCKHWHQIMHFITKVSTMTSMIIIMKDWLREYRSKVQKVLFTRRKLFPKTKKKNWSKKSSVFVLWQRGLEG